MKKQNSILFILISWLLGLSCCHFLAVNKNKNTTTAVTDYKILRKQLQETENNYRQQTTALLQRQVNILRAGEKTTALLEAIKNKNYTSQQNLRQLISYGKSIKEKNDTIMLLANCDSLEKQTTAHLWIDRQQDSVQQLVTANYAAQIKTKDTIINVQEKHYRDLTKQINYSLSQQQVLEANLKIYQRKLRRMQWGSRLKNIGLIVLAGLTINKLAN